MSMDKTIYIQGIDSNIIVSGYALNGDSPLAPQISLILYDSQDAQVAQTTVNVGVNGFFTYTLGAGTILPGIYRVTASASGLVSNSWFTYVKTDSWSTPTFPIVTAWKNIAYTLTSNRVLNCSNGVDWISLTFPSINGFSGLTQTAYVNSMGFRYHLTASGGVADLDLAFILAHNGLKFYLRGTQNIPRTFTVQVSSSKSLVRHLDGVHSGSLCFDFSDLTTNGLSFTYSGGLLSISAGTSFFLDPTIFSDGFESNDFTAWSGSSGSVTVSTSVYHHGTHAMLSDANSEYCYEYGLSVTTLFCRVYFYMTDVPDVDGEYQTLMSMTDTGYGDIAVLRVRYSTDHTVLRLSGYRPSYTEYDYTYAFSDSTWYCVEFKMIIHASTGEYRAWIEGSEVITQTGLNTSGNNIMGCKFGVYSSSGMSGNSYFDCCVIDSSYIGVEGGSAAAYEDYIDNDTSDIDSAADVGTSSIFNNQKATDSTYDTLSEAQVLDGYVTDYVDNDSSNVDSSADKGSSSTFNNQKATDSTYDTLTEADDDSGTSQWGDTSGSGGSYRTTAADEVRLYSYTATSTGEVASIVFYGRGSSATNAKAIITDSSGNLLTNGVGAATAVSTSAGTKTLTYTAGSRPLVTSGTTYWIGLISQAAIRIYYDSTTGSTSKQDTTNSYASPTSPTDAGSTTETWRLMYANVNNINYRLDLEVQFTSVDTTKTVTEVYVVTGTLNGESLGFYIRNGGSWVSLGTLAASSSNHYTVTGYLAATMTFQFLDGTTTNDISQSSWQIDSVYLYQHNENYRLSYEEQFTSVEFSRNTEYLCIKTGTYSNGETLKVSYWTGGAWSILSASLTASSWNNISVSLTSGDYYILFEGGMETGGDAVQSTWQLDAVLLKTWWQYTPTLSVSSTYAATRSLIMLKAASQSLTFTKSAGKLAEWIKSVSQTLSYSSVVSRIREVTKAVSQALSWSSTSARLFEAFRSAAKSINFSGVATRVGELLRSAAQTLSYSSTVSRIKEIFASASKSLSFSSASSRLFESFRAAAQGISFSDITSRLGEWVRSASQSLSYSSIVSSLKEMIRSVSQAIGFSSASAKLMELIKSVSQSFSFGSLASRGAEIIKSASQSLSAVTGAGRLYEATRNAVQSLTLGGVTSRIFETARSVAQAITSAFSASKANEYLRSVGQNLTAAFNITRLFESFRGAGQNVTVSGLSTRLFEASRNVSQAISSGFSVLVDFFGASVEYFRNVTANIGVLFSTSRLMEFWKVANQTIHAALSGTMFKEYLASISLGITLLIHVTTLEPTVSGIPVIFIIILGFMLVLAFTMRKR